MYALNMPFASNYMKFDKFEKFNNNFKKLVTNLITFQ